MTTAISIITSLLDKTPQSETFLSSPALESTQWWTAVGAACAAVAEPGCFHRGGQQPAWGGTEIFIISI